MNSLYLRKFLSRYSFLALSTLLSIGHSKALLGGTLEKLESQALTQYDDFLPKMERETVHEIQVNPNSSYAHYILSYEYLRLYSQDPTDNSRAEKAVSLAQQSLDLDESSEFGYLALSDTYQALGFGEKAWSILQNVPNKTNSWRVLYRNIKFQYEPMNPRTAFHLLKSAAIQNPESRDILVPLMLTLSKNFSGDSLFDILKNVNAHLDHPLLKQELAIQYISKKRFYDAQVLFEKISRDASDRYPEIMMNYGILLFSELKKYAQARKVLEDALKLHYLPKILVSTSHMYLSLVCMKLNDQDASVKALLQALETSSQQLTTLEFVALEIVKQKPNQFANYMNAVNARFPGNAEFYVLQGKLYSENLGLPNEALAQYAKAAILEPDISSDLPLPTNVPVGSQ